MKNYKVIATEDVQHSGACHREKCVNICLRPLTGFFLNDTIRKIVLIIDCLGLVKVV